MAKSKNKTNVLIDPESLKRAILAYNPWWGSSPTLPRTPDFTRDAFDAVVAHADASHSLAILINGLFLLTLVRIAFDR